MGKQYQYSLYSSWRQLNININFFFLGNERRSSLKYSCLGKDVISKVAWLVKKDSNGHWEQPAAWDIVQGLTDRCCPRIRPCRLLIASSLP